MRNTAMTSADWKSSGVNPKKPPNHTTAVTKTAVMVPSRSHRFQSMGRAT